MPNNSGNELGSKAHEDGGDLNETEVAATEVTTEREAVDQPAASDDRPRTTLALVTAALAAFVALVGTIVKFAGWLTLEWHRVVLLSFAGIAFALAAPSAIRQRLPSSMRSGVRGRDIKRVAWAIGAVTILLLVGAFALRFTEARGSEATGLEHSRQETYAQARRDLQRSVKLYRSLGLPGEAHNPSLVLIDVYFALGRPDLADEQVALLEQAALNDSEEARLLGSQANMASVLGDLEAADRYYRQAEGLVADDTLIHAALLQNQANSLLHRGGKLNREEAVKILADAATTYRALDDKRGQAEIFLLTAQAAVREPEKQELLEKALALVDENSSPRLQGNILHALGLSQTASGHTDDALESLTAALRIFQQLDDPLSQATVHGAMANAYIRRSEAPVAREHLAEAALLVSRIDLEGNEVPPRQASRDLATLATAYASVGDMTQATDLYHDALNSLDRYPDTIARIQTLINLASLAVSQGAVQEARSDLDEAEVLLDHVGLGETAEHGELLALRSRLALITGDTETATLQAEQAERLLRDAGDVPLWADHAANLGFLYLSRGERDRAAAVLENVENAYDGASLDVSIGSKLDLLAYHVETDPEAGQVLAASLLRALEDPRLNAEIAAKILIGVTMYDAEALGRLDFVVRELEQRVEAMQGADRPLGYQRLAWALTLLGAAPEAEDAIRSAASAVDELPDPDRAEFLYDLALRADDIGRGDLHVDLLIDALDRGARDSRQELRWTEMLIESVAELPGLAASEQRQRLSQVTDALNFDEPRARLRAAVDELAE